MHPQLKLKYFQQHGWKKEWITTAEALVREEFAKYRGSQEPIAIVVCIV
jgi:hypothetical protein